MPDAYELAMGLNPTNAADAVTSLDSDPFSNLDEYIAGTDPQDPLDYLKLQVERFDLDELRFSWQSILGRRYRIESCTSLATDLWTPIQNFMPGTGQSADYIEPSDGVHVYYRLVVEGAAR